MKIGNMKIILFVAMAAVLFVAWAHGSFAQSGPGFFEDAKTEFSGFASSSGIETKESLTGVIGKIISVVLGLLGIILLVLIIYAGWLWMSAGGDSKQVDKAKDYIKNAVIGLVLILMAYVITGFVIDKLTLIQQ